LWDTASGKELRQLNGYRGQAYNMTFSPNGRLLAASGVIWDVGSGMQGSGAIWDVASGKQVAALTDKPVAGLTDAPPNSAFSCDGRSLATASLDGTIRIWETATWTERTRFKGHLEELTAVAFTPSGQLLCAGLDTTVLGWDLRPPRVAASVPLERAWNDLATWEAGESFRSAGRFLAAPAETVKLFAEKIKPVAAFDPKRVQRLLADLGSDVFAAREAASQALGELDVQAIPYLEEAMKNAGSLEIRLRVKPILERKQREQRAGLTSSEQLRQMRAVMVLEWIGDGESKNLLKRWAGGSVGARLALEAAAALKRLETVSQATR
jgi:hypothetical protein